MLWLRRPAEVVFGMTEGPEVDELTGATVGAPQPTWWIRQRAGLLEWFAPTERPAGRKTPWTYLEFANISDAHDAAEFATQWGLLQTPEEEVLAFIERECAVASPLPDQGPGIAVSPPLSLAEWKAQQSHLSLPKVVSWTAGETWSSWRSLIAHIRGALTLVIAASGEEDNLSCLDVQGALDAIGSPLPPASGPQRQQWQAIDALRRYMRSFVDFHTEVTVDVNRRWRIESAPKNLLSLLWWQFGLDLTAGRSWRVCARPGCGSFFRVERDTQRWCVRCSAGYGRMERKRRRDRGEEHPPQVRAEIWPAKGEVAE